MGAYMYPIKIKRDRQRVECNDVVDITKNSLTLEDLKFVGGDCFDVSELGCNGYRIVVYRHRLETTAERDVRVAKEKLYMAEYNRRQSLKTKT